MLEKTPKVLLNSFWERCQDAIRRDWRLVGIMLAALALRLAWAIFWTGSIHPEGTEYARIAENLVAGHGYVGLATPGKELMFPPLFPLLIAAFSYLTHGAEFAGRLVSILMGTLFVVPIFFITARMYGRGVAHIAAVLAALHPFLVGFSATVYSEMTYMTLVFAGIGCAWRCLDRLAAADFVLTGIFFGLAYLIRPEAGAFSLVAILFIVGFSAVVDRRNLRPALLRSALIIACFAAMAAPYVIWLSAQAGQFRLEGKSPLLYVAAKNIINGMSFSEAYHRIDQNLNEQGIFLRSNLSVIQEADFSVTDLLRLAAVGVRDNLPEVARDISSGFFLGSPILFALAILGLFASPWNLRLAGQQLFFVALLGLSATALLFYPRHEIRYDFMFLPVMLIWGAGGLIAVGQWAGSTLTQLGIKGTVAQRGGRVVQIVLAAGLLLVAFAGVNRLGLISSYGPQNRPIKTAGEWLDRFKPGPKTVMDSWSVLAFHAHATLVPFPHADPALVLRYIEKRKVDFIVLTDLGRPRKPYLGGWIDNGIPSPHARLVYNDGTHAIGRVLIYQWVP